MRKLAFICVMILPTMLLAKIPTPDSVARQKASTYGTYTSQAGSWGYQNTDPILASRSFGASNSYGQYSHQQGGGQYLKMGMTLLSVFTGKGTFGEKVKFLMMDQLNKQVAQPLESHLTQSLSLEQLFALANRGAGNTNVTRADQILDQCVGCGANTWRPTNENPHSVQEAISQATSAASGRLGGIVAPVQ